ncbi:MAG: hypothetical protein KatS3mg129_1982 [Leptospiraceae bacterium]|nr:MAG: hypothetical protein KatS3mg129_1982 [Leptospiraceae bacterium]
MKIKDLQFIVIIYIILIFLSFGSHISFCPFYNLTHLPCPGCGMTRAIQNLLMGNFSKALKYHHFSYFVFFIIIITLFTFISKKIYNFVEFILQKDWILIFLLLVIIIYGIIRIILFLYFPYIYNKYFFKIENQTIGEFIYEFIK